MRKFKGERPHPPPHPIWPMLMLLACCVLTIGFFLKNIISIFLLMPPLFFYKSYLKFEKKTLKVLTQT